MFQEFTNWISQDHIMLSIIFGAIVTVYTSAIVIGLYKYFKLKRDNKRKGIKDNGGASYAVNH